jgi:hypothetical protein
MKNTAEQKRNAIVKPQEDKRRGSLKVILALEDNTIEDMPAEIIDRDLREAGY